MSNDLFAYKQESDNLFDIHRLSTSYIIGAFFLVKEWENSNCKHPKQVRDQTAYATECNIQKIECFRGTF